MSCAKYVVFSLWVALAGQQAIAALPYRVENIKVTPWRENVAYITKTELEVVMSDSKLTLDAEGGQYEAEELSGGQYRILAQMHTIGLPLDEHGRKGIWRRSTSLDTLFTVYRPDDTKTLTLRWKPKHNPWYKINKPFDEKISPQEIEWVAAGKGEYAFREVFDAMGENNDFSIRWDEKDFTRRDGYIAEIVATNRASNAQIEPSIHFKDSFRKESTFSHYAIFGQDKPRLPGDCWEVPAELLSAFIPSGSINMTYEGKLILKAERLDQKDIPKELPSYSGLKITAVQSGKDTESGRKRETSLKAYIDGSPMQCSYPRLGENNNYFVLHLDSNFEHVRYIKSELCFENFKGRIPEIGEKLKLKGNMDGRLILKFGQTTEIAPFSGEDK